MPTPTYTALANITLGSAASTVTFSSIPATYRDLVLITNAATTSASNNGMRLNADTGSNYSRVFMATGATPQSGSQSGVSSIQIDSAAFSGTIVGEQVAIIQIMDYSATDKHKTVLIRSNRNGANTGADGIAGRYASTSAITSINLFSITGGGISWAAGSRFDLYGIAS